MNKGIKAVGYCRRDDMNKEIKRLIFSLLAYFIYLLVAWALSIILKESFTHVIAVMALYLSVNNSFIKINAKR